MGRTCTRGYLQSKADVILYTFVARMDIDMTWVYQ